MRDETGRGGVAPVTKEGGAPREVPEGGSGSPLRREGETMAPGPGRGERGFATAQQGGRLRRRAGGRRRIVKVLLSPEEEAWIVPKAAAEGLSVQRFLVESAHARGPAFAPRPSAVPRVLRRQEGPARGLHEPEPARAPRRTNGGRVARWVSLAALPKWGPPWSDWSSSPALLVAHPKSTPGGRRRGDRQGHAGRRAREAVGYLFSPGRHNEHEDPHVVAAAAALGVSVGLRPSEAEMKDLEAAMEAPSALYGTRCEGVCAGTWRCRPRAGWTGT